MTGFLRKIILLLSCVGVMMTAHAQVSFTATLSPSQINKNEYTVLRLEIQNGENIEQIVPPALKGFTIVSGPNQESGMSSVNGVTKQYVAISYILQPESTGTLYVEPSTAKIAGKSFKTNKLSLVVKNGKGAAPRMPNVTAFNPFAQSRSPEPTRLSEEFDDFILKKGESVPEKVNRSMFLKLQTNKNSCYVGEPIVASYKLYTRLKSESKLSKTPSFNGFSVIDLQRPDETAYAREKLNGREYNVYTIRKAQLYPLQDGVIELESATLDNHIQFLKAEATGRAQESMSGFLEGFAMAPGDVVTEFVSLSNKPLSVTVKPLPLAGKPASFKGAVGNFNVTTKLEKNAFSTTEAGKLTVTISGNGNLQLVTPPDINWPKGVETFEPRETEDLQSMSVPVSGSKTIEFPFTVSAPGQYDIPAIEFSYFDPAAGRYKTILLQALHFDVSQGVPRKPVVTASAALSGKSTGLGKTMFENRGWVVAIIGLLIFSGLLIWLKRDHSAHLKWKAATMAVPPIVEETALQHYPEKVSLNLENPLSKADDCLRNTDCSQFYSLLYAEIKDYLAYKFDLRKEQMTSKSISVALDRKGIDNGVVLELQQLIQEIEWQLYTPGERNEEMALFYSRSQSVLQTIETYETATL